MQLLLILSTWLPILTPRHLRQWPDRWHASPTRGHHLLSPAVKLRNTPSSSSRSVSSSAPSRVTTFRTSVVNFGFTTFFDAMFLSRSPTFTASCYFLLEDPVPTGLWPSFCWFPNSLSALIKVSQTPCSAPCSKNVCFSLVCAVLYDQDSETNFLRPLITRLPSQKVFWHILHLLGTTSMPPILTLLPRCPPFFLPGSLPSFKWWKGLSVSKREWRQTLGLILRRPPASRWPQLVDPMVVQATSPFVAKASLLVAAALCFSCAFKGELCGVGLFLTALGTALTGDPSIFISVSRCKATLASRFLKGERICGSTNSQPESEKTTYNPHSHPREEQSPQAH